MPVAPKNTLLFQRVDMFKDSNFARAKLIGQFLHGGRIPMQMPKIANRNDHVELPGSKVHDGLPCECLDRLDCVRINHYPNNRQASSEISKKFSICRFVF